ncbi:MAG: HEAT repeat domain-containing protein [Nitrospirae bacterium]|nr:HEAT repeat domain-containing protein [Nitrospirota bacterium]
MSRVRLSLIVLSAMLFAASGGMAASSDVDRIVTELEGPDWQDSLSSSAWVARFNNDSSFQALTELISNKGIDWRIRIRAIRLMGETGNPRGISLLARILNDPVLNNDCPAIKWNTATALGNFRKDSTVLETLIYTLKFENNNVVREAVIESLGKVGDPRAVPSLLPALLDGSFAIKFSAIKALGEIGDPAATPFLKRLSDNDSDPYIRNEALAVLKKLGGKAQG